MKDVIDVKAPIPEIIDVLHRYQIPISCIDQVFKLVREEIYMNTIPYNPSLDNSTDLAISEMTDNATDPKG